MLDSAVHLDCKRNFFRYPSALERELLPVWESVATEPAALLSSVPSVSQLPVSEAVVVSTKALTLAVVLKFPSRLTTLQADPAVVFLLIILIKDLCRHSLLLLTLLAAAEVVTET